LGEVSVLRRPRALASLLVIVLIVGAGTAWLVPPLAKGDAGVAAGPPGGKTESGQHGETVIFYVPGGTVGIGTEVRNASFVPVTITGLTGGFANAFLLQDTALVLGTDPGYVGLEDGHTIPFAPITLSPGESRLIGVVGRFPDCAAARPNWATGSGVGIDSLHFDVRIAGILPREADVPLLIPVELRGDADAACP
jgi:hypothetical protein